MLPGGAAGPGRTRPTFEMSSRSCKYSGPPLYSALLQLSLGNTLAGTSNTTFKYSLIAVMYGHYTCQLSYLNLEKIYSPPGRLLRLGLATLSSLMDDGWDTIHSIASPALSWHAAGSCWLVSTIRKVKQMISHARLGLLGDIDSADRNVLCLLPASVYTG